MLTLSLNQVIVLWSHLEQCYYGDNSYGGDECEIYEYTVFPRSPLADNSNGDMGKEESDRLAKEMWTDLCQIFTKFQNDRDCKIKIKGKSIKKSEYFNCRFHRIHIKVIRNKSVKRFRNEMSSYFKFHLKEKLCQ